MQTVKLTRADELKLRRWLMQVDPDLALHPQLRQYFLADTERFGTLARLVDGNITAVCLYTQNNDRSVIHQWYGPDEALDCFLEQVGTPCDMFLRDDQELVSEAGWRLVLEVTPGFVIDHPLYDGLFSRVVPRFKGKVYTC